MTDFYQWLTGRPHPGRPARARRNRYANDGTDARPAPDPYFIPESQRGYMRRVPEVNVRVPDRPALGRERPTGADYAAEAMANEMRAQTAEAQTAALDARVRTSYHQARELTQGAINPTGEYRADEPRTMQERIAESLIQRQIARDQGREPERSAAEDFYMAASGDTDGRARRVAHDIFVSVFGAEPATAEDEDAAP